MKKTILPPSIKNKKNIDTDKIPPSQIEAQYLTVAKSPVDLAREIFSIRAHDLLGKSKNLNQMVNSVEFSELQHDVIKMTNFEVYREIMIDWIAKNLEYVKEDKTSWEFKF